MARSRPFISGMTTSVKRRWISLTLGQADGVVGLARAQDGVAHPFEHPPGPDRGEGREAPTTRFLAQSEVAGVAGGRPGDSDDAAALR